MFEERTGGLMVLLQSDIKGYPAFIKGKVRDVYDLGDNLLIVATDRISAFDSILPTGIPDKGKVLTQLSVFWFGITGDIVPNHLISADVADYPEPLRAYADQLEGRSMLVKKAERLDVECVVRGYLAGSGWKEYQADGTVCGIALPAGLRQADKLPELIFTPAFKADSGHDENISRERMVELIGEELTSRIIDVSLSLYRRAADYARERGVVIADTKFEFGLVDGVLTVIDEVLTPDSSRFWDPAAYTPGSSPMSYDKQFVRDYLESINWDKEPPAPGLPEDIVAHTADKYREVYRLITGVELQ